MSLDTHRERALSGEKRPTRVVHGPQSEDRAIDAEERVACRLLAGAGWSGPELGRVFQCSSGTATRCLREGAVWHGDDDRLEREACRVLHEAGWSVGVLAMSFGWTRERVAAVLGGESA